MRSLNRSTALENPSKDPMCFKKYLKDSETISPHWTLKICRYEVFIRQRRFCHLNCNNVKPNS